MPRRRSPSSLILLLAPVALLGSACEEQVPTQLVPLFDTVLLPGLPDPQCGEPVLDCCLAEGSCDDVSFTVRNIGTAAVRLNGVSIEAAEGRDADLDAFANPELDTQQIARDEQAVVRFRYLTPGGEGRQAVLVIESDAEVNPRLEVPIEAFDFVPPPVNDGGPAPDAGPDPVEDAGPDPVEDGGPDPVDDAGPAPADAGADAADAG